MDYIVKDAYISCVMSENGKHWNITTHERPEIMRTCRNATIHRYYGFECSECKWSAYELNDYDNDVRFDDFNYCPNCGAKVVSNAD